MFDPNLGRWLQEDPIGFDAGDPNLYRALGNNPANTLDPLGLTPAEDYDRRYGPDSIWGSKTGWNEDTGWAQDFVNMVWNAGGP